MKRGLSSLLLLFYCNKRGVIMRIDLFHQDEVEKKYNDCKHYLTIKLQLINFEFSWFKDCGEWFVYIEIFNWGYRFSSMGNMKF